MANRKSARFRMIAAVAIAASMLLAAAPAGNSRPELPGDRLPSCGFGPRPLPAQQAEPDEEFWELFEQYGPGWTGADSTYSVLLPDGRTAWLFSDTFLGTVNPDRSRPDEGVHLVNNSIVVQDGTELTTLHGGTVDDPESLFIPTDGSSWYWVYDGVVAEDELHIFLIKFTRFGDGMWDWEWSGTDIVTLSLPDLEVQGFVPVEADNGIQYGAYVLDDRGYTYIYGIHDQGHPKQPHLARVPSGQLHTQDQWEYFTGSGWSDDPAATAPILDDSISNEYSVTPMRGGYVMIALDTSLPLDEWGDVVAYYSCSPEGPWTNRTVVYEPPETADPELWPYNAHAHPQFTKGGQLLISYNVNTSDFFSLWDDADRYRARFIRADLPSVKR